MPCSNCNCSESQRQACSSSSSGGASVKLPPRGESSETTPLWSTRTSTASNYVDGPTSAAEASSSTSSAPRKCEQNHISRNGVCCRELKPSDERTLISPDTVRDIIIGLSDGLTVPLALTAGLSGVGSTRIVVLAGAAELISGAVSMGVGGFLSAQAELQHYKFTQEQTRERVSASAGEDTRAGAMERLTMEYTSPSILSSGSPKLRKCNRR